jgi:hypothetical protein
MSSKKKAVSPAIWILGCIGAPLWIVMLGSGGVVLFSSSPEDKRFAGWLFAASVGLTILWIGGARISARREVSKVTKMCEAYCKSNGWEFHSIRFPKTHYSMTYIEGGERKLFKFRILKGNRIEPI